MKRKQLSDMNQEIFKNYEMNSEVKQKQHQRELQIELDNALKDKRFYDNFKVSEHMNDK